MLYVPKWLVQVVVHVSLGVHHVVCPQVAGASSGACFTGSACSGACFTGSACCMSPSGWCM